MSVNKNGLRILTWNLWFEDKYIFERSQLLLSYVEPLQPDIIAFQELTEINEALILATTSPLHQNYRFAKGDIEPEHWYWEGVFYKSDFTATCTRVPYDNSQMGRGVTILHLIDLDLVIGCTHLESLDNPRIREAQASQALQILDSYGTRYALLTGDMNLHKGQELDHLLPNGWTDTWNVLHPDIPGFTLDSSANPLVLERMQQRLDRIYMRSHVYTSAKMKLVGITPHVSRDGTEFCVSDHFGLLLDIKLS